MKPVISANIHYTSTFGKECVVSVYEDSTLIVESVNIGLELNPDGTANTQWIKSKIRNIVESNRFSKKEQNENIFVSIK